MTNDEAKRITQIEARLEAATPGPWEASGPQIEQIGGDYTIVVGLEERGVRLHAI
jgi:hypothetical protein